MIARMERFQIRFAVEGDVPLILQFIRDLARYERLEHLVVCTEEQLGSVLFGERRYAEVIIGEEEGTAAGFARSYRTPPMPTHCTF